MKTARMLDVERRAAVAESVFMRACRRQAVERTPIWLMRQAGRYQPEFRAVRAEYGFLELCKTPEKACEVTVMAVEMLNVDAAIIFADILLPIDALGLGLEYVKGEGPQIHRPVRSRADVDALPEIDVANSLGYVYEAIELTAQKLRKDIPLIGFAGAPFTLASYMIEGGGSKNFEHTKRLMYSDESAWNSLMSRIVEVSAKYLQLQVEAGADALQIFDSWVGCLSPADYRRFVLPHSKKLIDTVGSTVPVIHFGTNTATLLPMLREAGGDVIGMDWRISLDKGWKVIGHDRAVQGNLDPTILLGEKREIKSQAERILKEAGGRAGHVFNLGHGILPMTPVDNVKYLVEVVRNWRP